MIELFSIIALTSIWVLGLTIATQPDMILYSWRRWADEAKKRTSHKIYEPLIQCHWCMPSIHSVFGYAFYFLITGDQLNWRICVAYPIVVMGSSIINGLIWGWHKKIENQSKYFENVEKLTYFDIMERKKKYRERNSGAKNIV